MTDTDGAAFRPLASLLVVELSQGIIGPFCGLQLSSLGANVIKVEVGRGDWLAGHRAAGRTGLYDVLRSGKEVLTETSGEALSGLPELIGRADVVIADGDDTSLADIASWDIACASNSRLIWAEVAAHEERGLRRRFLSSELVMQMSVGLNRHLGRPDAEPVRAGFDIGSMATALYLFTGVLAALNERASSGLGQRVSVSMLASMTSMLQWNLASEYAPDEWWGIQLEAYGAEPEQGFVLADRPAYPEFQGDVAAWDLLMAMSGRADLALDPRFIESEDRRRNMTALRAELAAAVADWTYADLEAAIRSASGSIVPLNGVDEALDCAEANGLLPEDPAGKLAALAWPWRFGAA
jgi:CoA:oxalate CoA-transferase